MTTPKRKNALTRPVLLILAVLITLAMLRLGVWQLDRAQEKNLLVEQRDALASDKQVDLDQLISELSVSALANQRYRSVFLEGRYISEGPLFIDGRVQNNRVGYDVYSVFETNAGHLVLLNRGWVYAGSSREVLPYVPEPSLATKMYGRLNVLAPAPPMWNERYPAQTGSVWQYFPTEDLTAQYGQNLVPMVVELAPELEASGLSIQWTAADDSGVAMHKGYAFQWFSMALAFVIACLVLLIKSIKRPND